LHRELENKSGMRSALLNLGVAAQSLGDYERARKLLEESLALGQELKDRGSVALALVHLGIVAQHQGALIQAATLCRQSLVLFWEVGDKRRVAKCFEALARVAATQGQPEQAAQLFGAAEALREDIGAPLPPHDRSDHDRYVRSVRARLGKRASAAAWVAGRAMSAEEAVKYALVVADSAPPTGKAGRGLGLLTPREQEVAVLIARGLTNRQIATALMITEGTVENHVQHILNKLGFHSRAQIAAWAVEQGLAKTFRNE